MDDWKLALSITHTVNNLLWYADSGANIHVCRDKRLIDSKSFRPASSSVVVAGKARSTVFGQGIVRLHTVLKGNIEGVSLDIWVYYMPDSPANLLSISALEQRGIFWSTRTHELVHNDVPIGYAPLASNGLYEVQLQSAQMKALSSNAPTPLSLWHRRLGHMNYTHLRVYLKRLNEIFLDDCTDDHCDACKLVKTKRKPNRSGTNRRPDEAFHTIHTDLVPIKVEGFQGERYYVTITDDYTRWMEVYTMKAKSDWLSYLQAYIQWVENHFSKRVKIVRTDYGSELRSKKADEYFTSKGIQFEPAPTDAQDVNGVAEAHQRVLTIMVKTAILGGGIPDFLWPDITLAMAFVKNRRPTSFLAGKTPYEALHSGAPRLSVLHPLGATVYAVKDKKHQDHLTPNSDKGMVIGYDGDTIYRVWIPEKLEIRRVKDLSFYDHNLASKSSTAFDEGEISLIGETVAEQQPSESTSITPSVIAPKAPRKPLNQTTASSSQGGPKPMPQKYTTLKSGRQATRVDLTMDREAYSIIHEATPLVFNAAMVELLANWDAGADKLIALMTTISNAPTEDLSRDRDAINPVALLAGHIESIGACDLSDFTVLTATDEETPVTFKQAMAGPHSKEWWTAIQDEINSLERNNTWTLVSRTPDDRKPLGGRWVFTIKRDSEGRIARYKARWVVKGYLQQYGVDFEQTFASVVKPMAFRVLFAIAAFLNLEIEQMDVKTAFLNGDIDVEVYVRYPDGFDETRVCKLQKALYGLKQSPRLWYERFAKFLFERLGLKSLDADHSIFASAEGLNGPILTVWVDDIKIISPNVDMCNRIKRELNAAFEMVDLGPISFYLGMTVVRDRIARKLVLSQKAYIKRVATKFGLSQCKPVHTPMEEGFDPLKNEDQATEKDIEQYQSMIGSVMFAMIETRPDIANAVSIVSRFAQNPSQTHMKAARRIIAYLSTTCDRGITYGEGDINLQGYCDANWAGDRETRKSTGSYLFTMNGGPVSWMAKLQPTVATSTCVAEYIAISFAVKEATWLRLLLVGIIPGNQASKYAKILIRTDSQSALSLAENPVHHDRTKHVDVVYHYIRQEIKSDRIELRYIQTDLMPADGLTKPLGSVKFHRFLGMLGMR